MASAALIAPRVTESALARLLGVSRQAIHDLVKRKVLEKGQDNLIDVELARVALANRVRPSSKTGQALADGPSPAGAAPQPGPAAAPGAEGQGADQPVTSYHVAKTLRETAEARIAQIKLAELQRRVIPIDTAQRAAQQLGRMVRDALAASRRRLSPLLAASDSVTGCEEIQRAEHIRLLQDLATGLAAAIQSPELAPGLAELLAQANPAANDGAAAAPPASIAPAVAA